MSLVFFGSGEFALPALEALARGEASRPRLAVTRPDRPGRRGLKPTPTPVRERALALGLPLETPETANDPAFIQRLRALEPAVFMVIDYGEILRKDLRSVPRIGCFNLHASLLPRHRGAAPVPAALLAGDEETGVTLFRIGAGLDTGPVVDRARTAVLPLETAGELEERLARLGAELLEKNIERLLSGKFPEEPQRDDLATLAPKLPQGAGALDWSLPARDAANFIRAMSPRPGAYSFLRRAGQEGEAVRIRILRAREAAGPSPQDPAPSAPEDRAQPGAVVRVDRQGFQVACGSGRIEVLELQAPAKAVLPAADFLRGFRLQPGDRFEPGPPRPRPPGA